MPWAFLFWWAAAKGLPPKLRPCVIIGNSEGWTDGKAICEKALPAGW